MKKVFALALCVIFALCISVPAFAADAAKDCKANTTCTHAKDCKDCKEKGQATCAKHKDCCQSKKGEKKCEKKDEKK